MKTLFLAWRASVCHTGYPIGRLDITASDQYVFRYTRGMLRARRNHGFPVLPAFPDLRGTYDSTELFPLFQNRVMNRKRRDLADYLTSLGLSEPDPIAMLAITGGERETDNLAVFPRIEKQADGRFVCRFFPWGWRDLSPNAVARALPLIDGERLVVLIDRTHSGAGSAIRLIRADGQPIGWAPRYLADELVSVAYGTPAALEARVVRVNRGAVPPSRRVLIELSGRIPQDLEPMSGEPFWLIGGRQDEGAPGNGSPTYDKGHLAVPLNSVGLAARCGLPGPARV